MATIIKGINNNVADYATSLANSMTTNSTIASELVQTFLLIAQNLGISVMDFIESVENAGTLQQQSVYLATYINSVRPRNALFGAIGTNIPPTFISREIGA
jgi:hypothetical protein